MVQTQAQGAGSPHIMMFQDRILGSEDWKITPDLSMTVKICFQGRRIEHYLLMALACLDILII